MRADQKGAPAPPVPEQTEQEKPREISLGAEEKSMLEEPIDPRVDGILQKLGSRRGREREEHARHHRFPNWRFWGKTRHPGCGWIWRIVPGP
jgi:hypothetical protein